MVAAATPQRVGPASAGRLRQLGICAFVGRTGISTRPNALELAEALTATGWRNWPSRPPLAATNRRWRYWPIHKG